MDRSVSNNSEKHRYELHQEERLVAILEYHQDGEVLDLYHTETLHGLEGRGLAGTLVEASFDDIKARGLKVRPVCSFVRVKLATRSDRDQLLA